MAWDRTFETGSITNDLTIGAEVRRDDIGTVGLYRTVARQRIGTTHEDSVVQSSYSAYASMMTTWSRFVRHFGKAPLIEDGLNRTLSRSPPLPIYREDSHK